VSESTVVPEIFMLYEEDGELEEEENEEDEEEDCCYN